MVVGSVAIYCSPYLEEYFKEGIVDVAGSLNDRSTMWTTGWKIFKRHPVIGNGVNTFFRHYQNNRTDAARYKSGSYAHNCYLQMSADIGVLGVGSFLFFIFFVFWEALKKTTRNLAVFSNSFAAGFVFGITAFLVHSFFDTNLYSLNLAALFWIGMGLIEGAKSCQDTDAAVLS